MRVVCQDSRMPRHIESMRDEVQRHAKASFFMLHNLAADRCLSCPEQATSCGMGMLRMAIGRSILLGLLNQGACQGTQTPCLCQWWVQTAS